MNAVEITSYSHDAIWFTWAFGTRIGCCTRGGVELDVDGMPSRSFREAIIAAIRRFKR